MITKIRTRGLKANYNPTTHHDIIYFCTDTNEIILNGEVLCVEITNEGKEGDILTYDGDTRTLKWTAITDVLNLKDLVSYGVRWKVGVSDPALERVGNISFHKTLPIQSKYRGCIVQGNEIQYYLNADDWTLKEDGTPSRLDGYDGQVMVEIPKFYGRSWDGDEYKEVRISEYKVDDTWVEIPRTLIGAFQSTLLREVPENMGWLSTLPVNAAISVCNSEPYCRGCNNNSNSDIYYETQPYLSALCKPVTGYPLASFREKHALAGTKNLSYEQYKWIIYWAYVIEYANFNSQLPFNANLTSEGFRQGGLGNGVTTFPIDTYMYANYNNAFFAVTPLNTGLDLGNHTGVKTITFPYREITSSSSNYWDVVSLATGCNRTNNILRVSGTYAVNTDLAVMHAHIIAGESSYTISGLLSGQSIIFYKNGVLQTITEDGTYVINWTISRYLNCIKVGVAGTYNITITCNYNTSTLTTWPSFNVYPMKYRGILNPFGDLWNMLDGVICDSYVSNHPNGKAYIYKCDDPNKYASSLTSDYYKLCDKVHENGIVKEFNLGTTAEIMPISSNATNYFTYKCDYHYRGDNNNPLKTVLVGGASVNGVPAGLACVNFNNALGGAVTGRRLFFFCVLYI